MACESLVKIAVNVALLSQLKIPTAVNPKTYQIQSITGKSLSRHNVRYLAESVPKGKIYPLSLPEQKAMEEYIEEALQQGYIHPSTSPAASSFFFVAKKDGGLRPCID